MSDLKLVKSKKLNTKKNNFWNTCPRALEFLPESHCHMGIPEKSKDNRIIKSPQCPWWINSPEHNYCFWSFIHDKSEADGSMKELVQSDLAKLFGWSSAKTHLMLKEAMDELVEAFKNHDLMDEIGGGAEHFEMMDINGGFDPSGDDY